MLPNFVTLNISLLGGLLITPSDELSEVPDNMETEAQNQDPDKELQEVDEEDQITTRRSTRSATLTE